ncbi:glycosyltransferase family 4 protein [Acidiferrimicrobium sp. IK]|uniref:glycosyltransferase family 4 protein n=1 Tax=Acidiferrimicrobium sp. IK TaxID=2871700 RepID=UPI0021CB3D0E|nr:glycosyltransferase family 4 protein [Acidiferrimicrobium sp. IK]MCU4184868.1 glycosyltransferase family 4 protein [Acidiferrimicrobium sp. IK]
MRVGLVCPYSLSLPGGVQGQVLGLGHALRARGVEARVLGPCDGPPPDANITPLGNSIPLAANGSVAPLAPDLPATLRVIRALRDEAFDVVHIHEPLVPGPTLSATIFCDSPMVGTFHRSGKSAGYRITAPLSRIAVGRLAIRTAVSDQARLTAMDVVGGDYEVLWNGIDTDRFAAASPWPDGRRDGVRTVLFIGRHEQRKGLAVLVDAMARLGPEIRLCIAGEGPDTARLRRLTEGDDRIEWLGTINDVEKVGRLRAADVFCAPSLEGESFGVVLLEGMAAGAAVVASDLVGYATVARPGVDALMVPPGDAAALADAIGRAAAGGPAIEAMISSARERADGFSMRRLAARYLELYESIVVPRRSPPPARLLMRRKARRSLPRAAKPG